MPSASRSASQHWSRRDVFRVFGMGAVGLAGLTACTDSGGSRASGPSATDTSGNALAEFHGAWTYQLPPTGHFNLFTDLLNRVDLGPYLDLVMAPGGMWYWGEQQWLYLVCSDFEFGEQRFVYKVSKDLTWSNGEPITARDVETTFWCRWIMHQREWEFIQGIRIDDERQLTFELSSAASVLEYYLLRAHVFPTETYGSFANRARNLFEAGADPDGPELAELNNEFQGWRPEDPADILTSGPFRYDTESMNDERIILVRNDSGVLANQVYFDRLVVHQGDNDNVRSLLRNKQVDYVAQGVPAEDQQRLEDEGFRMVQPPTYTGAGLLFCVDQLPMFKDVRARQALAYLIDREDAADIGLGDAARPVESMAGIPEPFVKEWLLPGDRARLNKYLPSTDRAAELLLQAGWMRQDNQWRTPDGQRARFSVMVSEAEANYQAVVRKLVTQFERFGIELKPAPVAASDIDQALAQGRFQLAVHEWGSGSPHPYFAYEHDLISENIPGSINQLGRGFGFELRQRTARYGTVDIEQLITQAGNGVDPDKQRDAITRLAMTHNELQPRIQIFERYGNGGGLEGERVQAWPAEGDPIYRNSPFSDNHAVILMYEGRLAPVRAEES